MAKKHILSTQSLVQVAFTDDEYTQLAELLRISQMSLLDAVAHLDRVHPSSPLAEHLRREAETAADLRERIEAR